MSAAAAAAKKVDWSGAHTIWRACRVYHFCPPRIQLNILKSNINQSAHFDCFHFGFIANEITSEWHIPCNTSLCYRYVSSEHWLVVVTCPPQTLYPRCIRCSHLTPIWMHINVVLILKMFEFGCSGVGELGDLRFLSTFLKPFQNNFRLH